MINGIIDIIEGHVLAGVSRLINALLLIVCLWPLGLTGIWLNFAGTALLAAFVAVVLLKKHMKELLSPDLFPDLSPDPD